MDGDWGTAARWSPSGDDHSWAFIEMTSPQNVGSVVFVRATGQGREQLQVFCSNERSINPQVDAAAIACNDGKPALNEGIYNCFAESVKYVHILWLDSGTGQTDFELSEIYVFEQPDFAQYYTNIDLSGAIFNFGSETTMTGPISIEDLFPSEYTLISGFVTAPSFTIQTRQLLSKSIILLINTDGSLVDTDLSSSVNGSTTQSACSQTGPRMTSTAQLEAECTNSANQWTISVPAISDWLTLDTVGIFPQTSCQTAAYAAFATPIGSMLYDINSGQVVEYILDTTVDFKPSWCDFSLEGPLYMCSSTQSCSGGEVSSSIFTFNDVTNTIAVHTTDVGLVGQIQYAYISGTTNDDSGNSVIPFKLVANILNVCTGTEINTFSPETNPTQIPYVAAITETITITKPTDTMGDANILVQEELCGPIRVEVYDAYTLMFPDYVQSEQWLNDETYEMQVFQPDDSYSGQTRQIVVEFYLDWYPSIPRSQAFFDVYYLCPIDISYVEITYEIPSPQFEHEPTSLNTSIVQFHGYIVHPGADYCWMYTGFKVLYSGSIIDVSSQFDYNQYSGELLIFGDVASNVIGDTDEFELYAIFMGFDGSSSSDQLIGNFNVKWLPHPCAGSYFSPDPNSQPNAFSTPLDTPTTFTITLENQVAINEGDLSYCGDLATSYVEAVSGATVDYVNILQTPYESYFGFQVTDLPLSVGVETLSFTVTSNLVLYPSVTTTFTVSVTFTCPSSPTIVQSSIIDYTNPFHYDLDTAGTQTFQLTTQVIYPTGCFFEVSTYEVWDTMDAPSEFLESRIQYNWPVNTISITIDTSLMPSMHGINRRYEARVVVIDTSDGTAFASHSSDVFNVWFRYFSANGLNDCPLTVMSAPTVPLDAQYQWTWGGPDLVVSLGVVQDYYGILYNDLFFCGDREVSIYWAQTTQSASENVVSTYSYSTMLYTLTINFLPQQLNKNHQVRHETTLKDFSSVTPYEVYFVVQADCPESPYTAIAEVAPTVGVQTFTHYFEYPYPQKTESVNSITDETMGYCWTFNPKVMHVQDDGTESIAHNIEWDIANNEIVYMNERVNHIGATKNYVLVLRVGGEERWRSSYTFSIFYDGPTNARCYFTDLIAPSSPIPTIVTYLGQDPLTTSVTFANIHDTEGDSKNNIDYCGTRTHSLLHSDGRIMSEAALTENSDGTMTLVVNTRGYTQQVVGLWEFYWRVSLEAIWGRPSVSVPITADIKCPTLELGDMSLPDPVTINFVAPMPVTLLEYNVSNLATMTASLGDVQLESLCHWVMESKIVRTDTLQEVSYIQADLSTNELSIYSEDLLLADQTLGFKWLVTLSDGQTDVELAAFSVAFKGTNKLPYFSPELSILIQIYRQPSPFLWIYQLPEVLDDDTNDTVTLTVSLDEELATFMTVSGSKFEIEDLSSPDVLSGTFQIDISLTDGKDTVDFPVTVTIFDPPPSAQAPETDEPLGDEDSSIEESDEPTTEAPEAEKDPSTPQTESTEEPREEQPPQTEEEQAAVAKAEEVASFVFDWRTAFQLKEEQMKQEGQFELKVAPTVRIEFLDQTGELQIEFDQDMQVPPSLDMITLGQVDVGGQSLPVLDIEVIPDLDQDPSNLVFSWECSVFEKRYVRFKLLFQTAKYVSTSEEPDKVKITIRDLYLFVGENDLAISVDNLAPIQSQQLRQLKSGSDSDAKREGDFIVLERELPQQLQLGGTEEAVQEALSAASEGSKAAIAGNFALNVAVSASLNQLWSMINTQQLIVMMPLFQIQLPSNAGLFFRQVMEIAAFDFYDFTDIIQTNFGIESTDPIDSNFESIGFESQYFLVNMGTMVVFYLVYLFLMLFQFSLCKACASSKKNKCARRCNNRLSLKLYWNSLITLILESYQIIMVCVLINIQIISFSSPGLKAMSVLCIVVLVLALLIPLGFICKLLNNFDRMKDANFKARFEGFYEELSLRSGKGVLLQPSFFLIRRFMLAAAVCLVGKVLIWQIFIMATQIVVQIMIIGSGVYHSRHKTHLEYFNELILLSVMYTIFCFSPWVSDVEVTFYVGYIAIGIVIIHLVVNLFLIFRGSCGEIKKRCRHRSKLSKLKKERKTNKARLALMKEKRLARYKLWQEEKRVQDELEEADSSDESDYESASDSSAEELSSSESQEMGTDQQMLDQRTESVQAQELPKQHINIPLAYFAQLDAPIRLPLAGNALDSQLEVKPGRQQRRSSIDIASVEQDLDRHKERLQKLQARIDGKRNQATTSQETQDVGSGKSENLALVTLKSNQVANLQDKKQSRGAHMYIEHNYINPSTIAGRLEHNEQRMSRRKQIVIKETLKQVRFQEPTTLQVSQSSMNEVEADLDEMIGDVNKLLDSDVQPPLVSQVDKSNTILGRLQAYEQRAAMRDLKNDNNPSSNGGQRRFIQARQPIAMNANPSYQQLQKETANSAAAQAAAAQAAAAQAAADQRELALNLYGIKLD